MNFMCNLIVCCPFITRCYLRIVSQIEVSIISREYCVRVIVSSLDCVIRTIKYSNSNYCNLMFMNKPWHRLKLLFWLLQDISINICISWYYLMQNKYIFHLCLVLYFVLVIIILFILIIQITFATILNVTLILRKIYVGSLAADLFLQIVLLYLGNSSFNESFRRTEKRFIA